MKIVSKVAALALVCLGMATAAHAQTSVTTTSAGGTVIQSNGATISTPGTASPAQKPAAGRPHAAPHVAPRSGARKPKDAAAPVGTKDLTIDGNNDHRTIDCQGNTVTVNGNGNRLLLRGTCTKLVLNGNENTVRWSGMAPAVSDLGNKNVTGHVN